MMSNLQYRIVITGGPGSGKSTLIDALIARGYSCLPEAGRGVIRDQVVINGNALPWGDRIAFSELMLCWEMRSWHTVKGHNQFCFFDRGLPDIAGYLNLCNLAIPPHLDSAIRKFRYRKQVFITPPWPEIYAQDTERKQSIDEAEQTYHAMVDIYQKYGYELLELPRVSVEKRADFIISSVINNG
ncbi:AAA family ATPase [Providencia heimbachae]|nr:AAA family ATPase [Providencia heimbachae]